MIAGRRDYSRASWPVPGRRPRALTRRLGSRGKGIHSGSDTWAEGKIMRYLGGKSRQARRIAEVINPYVKGKIFIEPFVGGFNIIPHIKGAREHFAGDIHSALISMYNALKRGWVPPSIVTEEEHKAALSLPDTDPRKAFIRFGCSWGGNFTSGYARDSQGTNFAAQTRRNLRKRLPAIKATTFRCCPYAAWPITEDAVFYCDPPYQRTTGYATGDFDHDAFWAWVRDASETALVFVSEITAPDDFVSIWRYDTTRGLRSKKSRKFVDQLFVHRPMLERL